ncbi:hypothetical protein [Asticcacaulis machinosus]|uniref:Uncharacterized protein n=1 Tax=Asticcacaulis machinosus TaxID=2984211 RepID=A0ABT5HMK3_9CAUL|nr:hypothetical protein [Asticcacaulis machinosus]MDC7677476.1 hypothetical protein [Asticcacaulis machinosus]
MLTYQTYVLACGIVMAGAALGTAAAAQSRPSDGSLDGVDALGVRVNYLVGNIADSPIPIPGSRWQPTAGITLAYSF